MKDIQMYFDACVKYWQSTGCSKAAAVSRAIWWDCVEVWNVDRSWNDNKISFINRYRSYKPYDPVPDESLVRDGNA